MHDIRAITLFEELSMKFMEEMMQIGLISKRKYHFVLIEVSVSWKLTFVSNSYKIARSLRNVLIKCAK